MPCIDHKQQTQTENLEAQHHFMTWIWEGSIAGQVSLPSMRVNWALLKILCRPYVLVAEKGASSWSIMINHGKLFPLFTGKNGGILLNKPPGIPPFFPVNKGQPGTAQLKSSWSSQVSWEINIWNHQAAATTVVTVIYSQEKLQIQVSQALSKNIQKNIGSIPVRIGWRPTTGQFFIGNQWQTSGFGVIILFSEGKDVKIWDLHRLGVEYFDFPSSANPKT